MTKIRPQLSDVARRQHDRYERGLDGAIPYTLGRSGYRPEPEPLWFAEDGSEPIAMRVIGWAFILGGVAGVVYLVIRVVQAFLAPEAVL